MAEKQMGSTIQNVKEKERNLKFSLWLTTNNLFLNNIDSIICILNGMVLISGNSNFLGIVNPYHLSIIYLSITCNYISNINTFQR